MKHRAAEPLRRSLAACNELTVRVDNVRLADYSADRDLQLITERLVIAIGECISQATSADESLLERIPNAHQIIGARNRVAHGYEDISDEIVWDIAVRKVPDLCAFLITLIGDSSESID